LWITAVAVPKATSYGLQAGVLKLPGLFRGPFSRTPPLASSPKWLGLIEETAIARHRRAMDLPPAERAQLLADELIQLCDDLGDPLAGDFVRTGVDRLRGLHRPCLREDRAPWGEPTEGPPPES
jgi:hypothetical protein